jgi:tetratricopeptide (TPR) repeat protein
MAILAVAHDPRIERWARGSSPPTFEAYEQLLAGLDLFSAGNWAEALPIWERAAALDSSFVQPLLHSVFGYMNLGRWAEADSLSRLLTRREGLTPFDRAMLDFQRAEISGDNMAVLAGAEGMVRAAPGDYLPYYLKAIAANRVNRPREALEAASKISSRVGRFGKAWASAGYWMVVTSAWHALGEHEEELRPAREAREHHPGVREMVWFELGALAALGRAGEVEARAAELEGLQATPAGRTLSMLFVELADELEAHGHTGSARTLLLRADRWQRTREGDGGGDATSLHERALTLDRLGDDVAADSIFALLEAERPEDWRLLANRGVIALRQGRTEDARRIAERLRTMRVRYDHGRPAFARAQLAAQAGDIEEALALLRLALAEGLPFGLHLHTTPALAPLRDEPEFRELLRPRG